MLGLRKPPLCEFCGKKVEQGDENRLGKNPWGAEKVERQNNIRKSRGFRLCNEVVETPSSKAAEPYQANSADRRQERGHFYLLQYSKLLTQLSKESRRIDEGFSPLHHGHKNHSRSRVVRMLKELCAKARSVCPFSFLSNYEPCMKHINNSIRWVGKNEA